LNPALVTGEIMMSIGQLCGEASLQGLPIKRETYKYAKVSQRLR